DGLTGGYVENRDSSAGNDGIRLIGYGTLNGAGGDGRLAECREAGKGEHEREQTKKAQHPLGRRKRRTENSHGPLQTAIGRLISTWAQAPSHRDELPL